MGEIIMIIDFAHGLCSFWLNERFASFEKRQANREKEEEKKKRGEKKNKSSANKSGQLGGLSSGEARRRVRAVVFLSLSLPLTRSSWRQTQLSFSGACKLRRANN